MTNTIKLLFFLSLIVLATACEKEEDPVLSIRGITSELVSTNDVNICESNGIAGTRIKINIAVTSNVTIDEMINQYIDSDGEGGTLTVELEKENIEDGMVTYGWCYWFEGREFFEETYKLKGKTMDGMTIESNSVNIKINRPQGAN